MYGNQDAFDLNLTLLSVRQIILFLTWQSNLVSEQNRPNLTYFARSE